ncbi:hypothetical protein [Phocaeicola barnesiae]
MIKRIYVVCFLLILCCCSLRAQMVKQITLSPEESYTEHIALSNDSKDLDVMVKFMFDEMNNRLSVTLLSYRSLFVFQDNVRYKQVVKWKKLRPDRLPYLVQEPLFKIKLPKAFRRQIPKPRKKFIFERWISYDGIQPVPQDYRLVNEDIEQQFDILPQRNELTVSLHHLFVIDSKEKKKTRSYFFTYFKDLDLEFHISLQRNPCLGTEVELEQAALSLENVRQSYSAFAKSFAVREVSSEEKFGQFTAMKEMLTAQFPHREMSSECPEVQRAWNEYNMYVDSIQSVTCTLVRSEVVLPGVGADVLLKKARQMDNMVTNWLSSTDKIERRDLQMQCQNLIDEVHLLVDEYGIVSEEEHQAWKVFLQAEGYFQRTVNNLNRQQ